MAKRVSKVHSSFVIRHSALRKFLNSAVISSKSEQMHESTSPRLAKWPFFLGHALLLALAWFIFHQSKRPMGGWEILACVACVGAGAVFSIWPFVLEYRSAEKLVEMGALTSVVSQVQNLEQLAAQISGATAQWQTVQESADKTARQAKEIAQGMATEAKSFQEFLKEANETEKNTLRLEVDKLRRIEAEWLQVVVRILDHVHALNRAAAHSRQPNVIEQLSRFQVACHDAARRVGLTPFIAGSEEKFDAQRHQVVDGQARPADGAAVDETLANGYTFQGRLVRPAVVRLRNGNGNADPATPPATTETATATQPAEDELPLA
jgi:molecular chaperone GrpE (heat shock protein)